MPLIPLNIPPGVSRGGTALQSSGRWYDTNLVRWDGPALKPVGGWRKKQYASGGVYIDMALTGKPRGSHAWPSNAGTRYLSVGTHTNLYAMPGGTNLIDITPTGFAPGNALPTLSGGYGSYFYGGSTFGTPMPITLATGTSEATTWAMDNFGQLPLALASHEGTIYSWDLNTANKAVAVTNAPTNCRSLVVTPERFLFALGAGGNARKVQWSDQEDMTSWTPSATNQAGDLELQTSGQIMAGARVNSGALVFTDKDVWLANYIGGQLVYGFNRVADVGVLSRKAFAKTPAGIVWMNEGGFYLFDGAVRPLNCEVADFVFSDIGWNNASLIWAMANPTFSEVWFFYPSDASGEVNRYVTWNWETNAWTIGALERTTGVEDGLFDYPIMVNASGSVYDHEIGFNHDGLDAYAQTGPIQIGNGDQTLKVNRLIPDELTQGGVTATFTTSFYPNGTATTHGPYTMSNPTPVRFTGRQVLMRLDGLANANWRAGIMRLETVQGGRR